MSRRTVFEIAFTLAMLALFVGTIYWAISPKLHLKGADTPEQTIQSYYKYLDSGQLLKVIELYDEYPNSTIQYEHDAKMMAGRKLNVVDRVTIISVEYYNMRKRYPGYPDRNTEAALVIYEITHKDGSPPSRYQRELVTYWGHWFIRFPY